MKSITNYINDFLEYSEIEKGLSPRSVKNYHDFLKTFIEWLRNTQLSQLTPERLTEQHIWDYRKFLARKPTRNGILGKKSQNYYLIALRNLLAFFEDRGIKALTPQRVKLPKLTDTDKKIKYLGFEQVEKLFSMTDESKAGKRDRAILELLFSTGMRVSELVALNIRNFNVEAIIDKKITEMEMSISGKGGSIRTVYLSERALEALGEYLKSRRGDMYSPLFINYKKSANTEDHRLTTRSIERQVRRFALMAGLPVDATPHTLRHSFATDLLNGGADIRSVQELLGHKNIITTQIYTHVTNKGLRDVHKKFHGGHK